jgi:hypothetical protein
MELVETKEKGQGDDLQHQEEEEVEMPSDEEKNITHRLKIIYRMTNGYRS